MTTVARVFVGVVAVVFILAGIVNLGMASSTPLWQLGLLIAEVQIALGLIIYTFLRITRPKPEVEELKNRLEALEKQVKYMEKVY